MPREQTQLVILPHPPKYWLTHTLWRVYCTQRTDPKESWSRMDPLMLCAYYANLAACFKAFLKVYEGNQSNEAPQFWNIFSPSDIAAFGFFSTCQMEQMDPQSLLKSSIYRAKYHHMWQELSIKKVLLLFIDHVAALQECHLQTTSATLDVLHQEQRAYAKWAQVCLTTVRKTSTEEESASEKESDKATEEVVDVDGDSDDDTPLIDHEAVKQACAKIFKEEEAVPVSKRAREDE